MPLDALMLGAFVRMQSGTPWNARGRDSQSSTAYLNYLEPAGTNRNPTWTNVDFLASYRFKLRESTAVTVEARVLNLFDAQTQTSTDVRKFLDFNSIPVPPYIGEYRQANPTFGTPNGLAPPRRFLAAVLVDF
jgi:outer membrane receptor protein involved in Fe transport